MSDKKSILLLGNYRPSLILARTFNARGFDVFVGSHGCERLCQHSNAVKGIWGHSSLDHGPLVLAEELRNFTKENSGLTAIIPVAEEYVRMFAENEDEFLGLPKIVTMDSELVMKCLNKPIMLSLADSANVPTAPFVCSQGLSQTLARMDGYIEFPIIVRPKDSTKRINGHKAITIENEANLIADFRKFGLENQEVLLQQKFLGKRHNVYFAAINGRITRQLHAVIERTDNTDGTGLAVDGNTLFADSDLVEQTSKILVSLNYSGIGCAQFLVNDATGKTSFLEINPRIAGNHALPEHAGLDLGWFNFERVVSGIEDETQIMAPSGIRYCWTSGDLMGAKVAYLRGEIGLPGFLIWLGKAMSTAVRADLHMVFSFKDPMPAIRGILNLIPRLARWRKPITSPGENTIYTSNQKRHT